jgi:hypothetical protein
MAIGYQTTQEQVNAQVGNLALGLRNACRQIINFQEWVQKENTAGLEALGFSADDAQAILTASNYLNTVAALFFGTAAQPSPFDFDDAVASTYGGN